MKEERTICAGGAWRADCNKKFSYQSGGPIKCPEYTRDLTIKDSPEEAEGES